MGHDTKYNFRRNICALALSIAALPILVNGQGQSLTSVNQDEFKDSVKEKRSELSKLISITLETGRPGTIPERLASAIGLPGSMPHKTRVEQINSKNKDRRACAVILDTEPTSTTAGADKQPKCIYLLRRKKSGRDDISNYYRVSLDGKLEKATLSQGKDDDKGNPIKGSVVEFDQDINSPEVRKAFDAEMSYWLKDWLKKEQKAAAKKAVGAVKTEKKAAPL